MLSLFLITVVLLAVTRWVYHLPESVKPPRPNTRKEPKP